MKQVTVKSAIACAALVIGAAARATTYTAHYDYVGKSALSNSQQDSQLDADTVACDSAFGVQRAMPSASYRRCMLQRGWRYSYLTRDRVVADPTRPPGLRRAISSTTTTAWIARTRAAPRSARRPTEPCITTIRSRA